MSDEPSFGETAFKCFEYKNYEWTNDPLFTLHKTNNSLNCGVKAIVITLCDINLDW